MTFNFHAFNECNREALGGVLSSLPKLAEQFSRNKLVNFVELELTAGLVLP